MFQIPGVRVLLLVLVLGLVCLGLLALTSGSGEPADSPVGGEVVQLTESGGLVKDEQVFRFIDTEAGVVCWIANFGYGAGVACMPLSETQLD